MEKKAEINPIDAMKTLRDKPLKTEQERLTELGFKLHGHYGGTELGMGDFIMLIAKFESEKTEYALIDNTKKIEIWSKPSALEDTTKEVREEMRSAIGMGNHRR